MTRLFIEVIGEDTAALHVNEVGARALDLRPAFTRIREMLIEGNKRQFASKGGYFGGSWPPLDADTVAQKGSSATLVATGALRASLTGGSGAKSDVDRSGVSVGTSVWYAKFQHGGTTNAPARKLVGIAPTDLARASEIIEDYVVRGFV